MLFKCPECFLHKYLYPNFASLDLAGAGKITYPIYFLKRFQLVPVGSVGSNSYFVC